MFGFFTAIKRIFIRLGLWAEKATETVEFNIAVIERGIRNAKQRAEETLTANGKIKGTVALLKDQIAKQERRKQELLAMLEVAAKKNDEVNGAHFAEQLADLDTDLKDNNDQLTAMLAAADQNTEIMAETHRQIRKYEADFNRYKAKVAMSSQMVAMNEMLKSANETLSGVFGGELGRAMDGLKQASVEGQGQIEATRDLSKKLGNDISYKTAERQARGQALFAEFKAKMQQGQDPQVVAAAAPAATVAAPVKAEKQRVET